MKAPSCILACLSALLSVFSARADYQIPVIPNQTYFIGSHLLSGTGNNRLANLLPGVPPDTTVVLWHAPSQNYSDAYQYFSDLGWFSPEDPDPDGPIFNPGTGLVVIWPSTATSGTLTIAGTAPNGFLPQPPADGRSRLVSRLNDSPGTTYDDIFGGPPPAGACTQLFRYDSPNGKWKIYSFSGGAWQPASPVMDVGEAVFVRSLAGDSTPPYVLSANRNCGSVALRFSEAVNPHTAEAFTSYTLSGGPGAIAKASMFENGINANPVSDSVVITFTGLQPSFTYTLQVNGVTDLCGNPMSAGYSFTFSPNAAPALLSIVPDCALGKVRVNFDSAMDPVTAANQTYYVIHDANGAIPVTWALPVPSTPWAVDLLLPGLVPGTLYTLTVNSVNSACGVAIAPNSTLSFVCHKSITGAKFIDLDGNGVWDGTEPALPNWPMLLQPGSVVTLTDANGNFGFSAPPGTYTLSEILTGPWIQTKPVSPNTYTVTVPNLATVMGGNDFGNQPSPQQQDLRIDMIATFPSPLRTPCCGQEITFVMSYANQGNMPVNGATVDLTWVNNLAQLQYQTFTATPALAAPVPSGTTLTWTLPTPLLPGAQGIIRAKFTLGCILQDSPTVMADASISPVTGDLTPANNQAHYGGAANCSYDPNELTVTPAGCGPAGLIPLGTTLTYLIQFQNEGTGPAYRVILRDTLPASLDVNTIQVLGHSHPYVLEKIGQQLVFTFDEIELPAKSVDEPGSHGYVKFTVDPMPALAAGTVIQNGAGIYFDLNPPVLTPITVNTVVTDPMPVAAFSVSPAAVTLQAPVNFTYTGGTAGAQFEWDFGTLAVPATSTAENPAGVKFTTPGPHLVSLRVRLGDCVSAPVTRTITVTEPKLVVHLLSAGQVKVEWSGDGFVLEETSSFMSPVSWQPATGTLGAAGSEHTLTATVALEEARFYRLRAP